ncbi:MAG: lysoplasmalogenase, partial [Pseudomonadota bacterium]
MVSHSAVLAIIAVVAVGALAILSVERRIRWLHLVTKPLATALLFAIVGWPRARLAVWVDAGIALSIVGDIALLEAGDRAFIVGLAAFLLAHLAYVIGFAGVAAWAPSVAVVAVLTGTLTSMVLRAIWRATSRMHGPVVAYGLAITAMVTAAFGTVAGGLPSGAYAAAGSLLFYASDSSLALNRFRRPIRHAPFLTLGLYWLGQIG